MAVESEADIVYLSQLFDVDKAEHPSFFTDTSDTKDNLYRHHRMVTSKNYRNLIKSQFGAKLNIPLRIIIDDINANTYEGNKSSVSDEEIVRALEPKPGYITFIISTDRLVGDILTPFMIGHRIGHLLSYHNNVFHKLIFKIIYQLVADNRTEFTQTELNGANLLLDKGIHDEEENKELFALRKAITPNLKAKLYQSMVEWVFDIVGLYFKYGRVRLHKGNVSYSQHIERIINSELQKLIGTANNI